jgi:hypothetical protein
VKVYIVFTERLPAAAEPSSSEQDTSAAVASYHHDLLGTVLLDGRYVRSFLGSFRTQKLTYVLVLDL